MLYNQIKSNKRKSAILVIAFFLLVVSTGSAASYISSGSLLSGAIIATIIVSIHIPISYFSAGKRVMNMSGAKEVSYEEYPELHNIVEELAIPARLPMPKIWVVDDEAPNAFASGMNPENSNVAVTTGLLSTLNREELEGVIAHELAHIQNFDVRLMSLSISLISVIVLISDFGSRFVFLGSGKKDNDRNPIVIIVALVFLMLSPLIAQMMRLMISRNREFLADATAVELTRNPEGLKSALAKISGKNMNVESAKMATAGMYIHNPFSSNERFMAKFENMMSTHPPIETRIERLNEM